MVERALIRGVALGMWKIALEVWRVGLIGGKELVIGHCQGW